MKLPKKIHIREVGCREGFQILSEIIPTGQKLRLIRMLVDAGLPEIEVGSFVRPDLVPQMADIQQIIEGLPKNPDVTYTGLYLNPSGFRRAEATGSLNNQAWIPMATSETFLKKNNNCTFDELLEKIPEWEKTFTDAGKPIHGLMISTAFGCNYEGDGVRDNLEPFLKRIIAKLSSVPKEICLADTTGRGDPLSVTRGIEICRKVIPTVEVSLHLHDTKGAGIANAVAGLQSGVKIFDASVGGLGGCPFMPHASGNIVTEELVALCSAMDIETGVDLGLLVQAAEYAEMITDLKLPSKIIRSAGKH